ncbi:hypothetical protein [Cyanobium sp. N5-Cardenillas]|uniref:hypothetical protein n=1 Tax=Cyanobium sp. N5-Cardenillas TaxID=2823720 RepID=UPI0020CFBB07|nr:hypothetical protein [Cyanobium sp. N5-Cardenillas]MCP9785612.1 hypothetical protein [Cyanobium sp. N5-Cardenillas]
MRPLADPAPVLGTTPPVSKSSTSQAEAGGSGGGGELIAEVGALLVAAVLVGVIVLVRRWLRLRSRPSMPGLPRERVLPFSRHGTLHDPKYLGRILEAEDDPTGP